MSDAHWTDDAGRTGSPHIPEPDYTHADLDPAEHCKVCGWLTIRHDNPECARYEPRAARSLDDMADDLRAAMEERVYGMCTGCGSVEVALARATGMRDLSHIGESAAYPTGYGCEVCA